MLFSSGFIILKYNHKSYEYSIGRGTQSIETLFIWSIFDLFISIIIDIIILLIRCIECVILSALDIRGLNSSRKRRQVFRWMDRQQPHIIFFKKRFPHLRQLKSGKQNGVTRCSNLDLTFALKRSSQINAGDAS